MTHPLDATFERLREASPYILGRVAGAADGPPSAGTIRVRLSDVDGTTLDTLLAEVARANATDDRQATAMLLLAGAAFYALMPALGTYLAEGRVLCLDPDHTTLDWPGGHEAATLTVCGASTEVGSDGVDRLQTEAIRAMAPLVDALASRRVLGRRTLWLGIADSVAGGLEWLGGLLGDGARGRAAGDAVIGRTDSPLRSPRARFADIASATTVRTVYLRATCCLSYKLPDAEYCMTCPLLDEEQRTARIGRWLADGGAAD